MKAHPVRHEPDSWTPDTSAVTPGFKMVLVTAAVLVLAEPFIERALFLLMLLRYAP